ncbi:MAG: Gfo/Idh/MocA family oxidoreductase [Planctomycetes bacterium]|nr:Gfo/Idh/MocA family oxidoreductase [Planctomycetota bacterium]
MSKAKVNRREMMAATAAGVGASLLAGSGARVLGAESGGSGVLGANERIVMGIIGSGGMGRGHMGNFKKFGVRWAAVCDVYEPNLRQGLEIAGDKAEGYLEHERLLERKDIDAVLIASPEHWHHGHLLAAMEVGKHAYCEKPMCWSIQQGVEMIKAVRKTDRIVQIGMQRRSSPAIRDLKKLFEDDVLGNVYLVQAEWYWKHPGKPISNESLPGKLDWERFCGSAGKQAFEPMKFRYWRCFWPFSGGNETDQGTHLMDVVQWMMGAERPISALQYGNVYVNKPTETPDVFSCTFEYPKFMATWTLSYTSARWRNGWSIVFHGEKAALFLTEQGYRIFDQVNGWENGLPKPTKEYMPGGLTTTEPHIQNFLECIKSGKQPNATVELGFQAVRPLHLANAALKHGTKAVLGEDGVTIEA